MYKLVSYNVFFFCSSTIPLTTALVKSSSRAEENLSRQSMQRGSETSDDELTRDYFLLDLFSEYKCKLHARSDEKHYDYACSETSGANFHTLIVLLL